MTIGDWVALQRPEVPPAFRKYLNSEASPSAEGFLEAAKDAFGRALDLEARDRAGAFALLAADAYVTFSCSALVEEGEGPEALQRLATELVREFS